MKVNSNSTKNDKIKNDDSSIKDFNPNFTRITIELDSFNKKDVKEQFNIITETLEKIYNGKIKISKSHVKKCIDLTCDPNDNVAYLPYKLIVEKRDNMLIFKSKKTISSGLVIGLISLFIIALVASTYSAVDFLSKQWLNKDLNNDGVADINLDIDGDGICDINCDNNSDNIPDYNIDYKNNKKAVFSIDINGDGSKFSNRVNIDKDGDGKCDINCDINDDGFPDINLDVDGDGKADLDIDTNNDNRADLNLDIDGDMKCDMFCDTDGDNKCDLYCTVAEAQKEKEKIEEEKKIETQIENATIKEKNEEKAVKQVITPTLEVIYTDTNVVNADEIFPDDQKGYNSKVPDKTFTLTNTSTVPINYLVKWEVISNTFISENFKYKVSSTNGGATLPFVTAPKETSVFINNATLPPLTTQKYTISFKLQGINAPQNYDQNRNFVAKIKVEIAE